MPITRVLDAKGRVLHDCADAGCEVSWDGFALAPIADVAAVDATATATAVPVPVAEGQPVPGQSKIGPEWEQIDAQTVRRRPDPVS